MGGVRWWELDVAAWTSGRFREGTFNLREKQNDSLGQKEEQRKERRHYEQWSKPESNGRVLRAYLSDSVLN
jgi:hypothetical protein